MTRTDNRDMRDRIMEELAQEPPEDWRGPLPGQAWYENTLREALLPARPEGHGDRYLRGALDPADLHYMRAVEQFEATLTALVREGIVGRSFFYNYVLDPEKSPLENNIGRDYFVWLKTEDKADWSDRMESVDRETVEFLYSDGPSFGPRFVFGRDAEVIERMRARPAASADPDQTGT